MFCDTKGVFSSRVKTFQEARRRIFKIFEGFISTTTTALTVIIANRRQHGCVMGALDGMPSPSYVGAATYERFLGSEGHDFTRELCIRNLTTTLSSFDELCNATEFLGAPIFVFKVYGNATSNVLIAQLIWSHLTDLSIPSTKISDSSQSR